MSVILLAHHTPDLYGSDRQLLETVTALRAHGHEVVVTLPRPGPLNDLIRARGADIELLDVPVLRRSSMSVFGGLRMLAGAFRSLGPAIALIRRRRVAMVYVNTLIIPFWLVAARCAGRTTICHVHEANARGPHWMRAALLTPLFLAHRVVANSEATLETLRDTLPATARRARVVHNGVPGPARDAPAHRPSAPQVLALVGRLSPNKGIDLALEATALLLSRGYDVRLDVAGTEFDGYEWYAEELRERAECPDLIGHVRLLGYVNPTWDLLGQAAVALAPSRTESFGNAAVEAQLATRPVVAARVQGLREVIEDRVTGLLVPTEDVAALAGAVGELLDDPVFASSLAVAGLDHARAHFSPQLYGGRIGSIVAELLAVSNEEH